LDRGPAPVDQGLQRPGRVDLGDDGLDLDALASWPHGDDVADLIIVLVVGRAVVPGALARIGHPALDAVEAVCLPFRIGSLHG
jgi:hypothetical protein